MIFPEVFYRANQSTFAALFRATIGPFAVALVMMTLSRFAVGASLSLYFAGMVIVATLLPPMVASRLNWRGGYLAALAILEGISIVWIISAIVAHESLVEALAACVVLWSVGFALASATLAGRRLIGPILAVAVATAGCVAWLSWPVWLSPWLAGAGGARLVAILSPVHPLLTLNHIAPEAGLWTQQPLMYQLTALGQDVAYALATSIVPCALFHVFIAAALWPAARRSPGWSEPLPARAAT